MAGTVGDRKTEDEVPEEVATAILQELEALMVRYRTNRIGVGWARFAPSDGMAPEVSCRPL
jgi:hypothetical protein